MSHKIVTVLGLLACLLGAALQPAAASESSRIGSCEVACDRASAFCEQKFGRNGKCQRKRQSCTEKCSGVQKDSRSGKQRRLQLCTQRCDLNRHTCEESNPNNERVCAIGQSNCIKRCK